MMNTFEQQLLTELRREVAEHPVTYPTPLSRSPRRRYAVAAVAAGAAAVVAAALGLTTLGGAPAYAVETDASGDVVVTVHRLDDASGLERALAAQGIDADVSYGSGDAGSGSTGPELPPVDAGGRSQSGSVDQQGPSLSSGDPGTATPPAADDPCGLGPDPADAPASLTKDGDDWVLTIPSGSPLLGGRHLDIGTRSDGLLTVEYDGNRPGSRCGVAQLGRP